MRIQRWVENSYGILLCILCLAFGFRIWGINSRDIWYDEALTILQSARTITQINLEVPTPVHYYFVHYALHFGRGTAILGSLSVIFGLATIFLSYLVAKKLFSNDAALVTAFLLAISPMCIEYSQQILFYSYYLFFSIASLFFTLRLAESLRNKIYLWLDLWLFLFFSAVNVLTHVMASVVLLMEIVYLIFIVMLWGRARYRIWDYRCFALVSIGMLASLLGFAVVFFVGDGWWLNFFKNSIYYDLSKPIHLGYSLSSSTHVSTLMFDYKFYYAMFSWFGIGGGYRFVLYATLSLIGLYAVLRSRKIDTILIVILWISIPFVFLYFIRIDHWFEEKYFIFILPMYLCLVAQGVVTSATFVASANCFARYQSAATKVQ